MVPGCDLSKKGLHQRFFSVNIVKCIAKVFSKIILFKCFCLPGFREIFPLFSKIAAVFVQSYFGCSPCEALLK